MKISYKNMPDGTYAIMIDGCRIGPPLRREDDARYISWWLSHAIPEVTLAIEMEGFGVNG